MTYVPSFMGKVNYFPTLPEVAVSIGVVAAGVLAFSLAVCYLPLFSKGAEESHEVTSGLQQAHAPSGD
jgi:Ni/Fe-hydrogenase subunit HybB-like protein